MYFPFELLCLVGLVGNGSRWRGGVGYLPPGHASALKSGKTGVLGADGEPEIAPSGRKLTDEEKAKIAKTDAEMIAKEKAERAAKKGETEPKKANMPTYASQKKKLDNGEAVSIGFGAATYNDATERTIQSEYRLRRATQTELKSVGAEKEGNYVVERNTRKGNENSGWQIMAASDSPEKAIAKMNNEDFAVAARKIGRSQMIQRAQKIIDAEDSK